MAFFDLTNPEKQAAQTATKTNTLRPCWAGGRKALFHRWVETARPVKPRGLEDVAIGELFQLSHVHALVEYQDGTTGRVWPQDIQFVDVREEFESYEWPPMEGPADADNQN